MRQCHKSTIYALSLIIFSNTASALPEDKALPYELTSDSAQFDQEKGIATYTGNVILIQGTMELKATEARAYMVEQELSYIEGDGPIFMKYLPDQAKPWVNGTGEKLHYDAKTGIATLIGKAKVTQGGDEITGNIMTYNTNTSVIKAVGGDKERVRIEIKANSELKKNK